MVVGVTKVVDVAGIVISKLIMHSPMLSGWVPSTHDASAIYVATWNYFLVYIVPVQRIRRSNRRRHTIIKQKTIVVKITKYQRAIRRSVVFIGDISVDTDGFVFTRNDVFYLCISTLDEETNASIISAIISLIGRTNKRVSTGD